MVGGRVGLLDGLSLGLAEGLDGLAEGRPLGKTLGDADGLALGDPVGDPLGLAEGLGLGKSLGLDLKTLMSVFSQTGANSRVLETDGEDMAIRDHECYFSADHAAKDSGIALKLATEQGLKLPLATATKAQYEKMKKLGIGGLDKSGIAELTFPGRKGSTASKGSKKK